MAQSRWFGTWGYTQEWSAKEICGVLAARDMGSALIGVTSAEDEARAMLQRAGIEQSMSAGDLVEIANLIAAMQRFTHDDVTTLRTAAGRETGELERALESMADRIEAFLPKNRDDGS